MDVVREREKRRETHTFNLLLPAARDETLEDGRGATEENTARV